MNGSCRFLRPFPDFSREIVAADSQLLVHIEQLLTGLLDHSSSWRAAWSRRRRIGCYSPERQIRQANRNWLKMYDCIENY